MCPIGTDQPPDRVDRILRGSGVGHLIAEPVAVDGPPLPAPVPGDPGDLAYVLHTSGSTGEPKGVELSHAAAMNTIDDLIERFSIGPGDRTIGLSELEFDLSVFDIFAPLSVGGAVVCVSADERRDAQAWLRLVARHAVTIVNAVPALVDMLVTAAGADGLELRVVLTGGDTVGVDLPVRVRALSPGCRFAGLGGTGTAGGHVQVTAYGPGSETCKVEKWSSSADDFIADVRCFDASGHPADARYTVLAIGPELGEPSDLARAPSQGASTSAD
jgi:non-ribosomal peptide synthetase component F